jgi:hypothetical protein
MDLALLGRLATALRAAPRLERIPRHHPELLQRTGWDGPRVARSSRHRPSGGASARTNPTSPPGTSTADGVGFEPTRQGHCPHALQACALNRSATRPNVAVHTWVITPTVLACSGGSGMGLALLGRLGAGFHPAPRLERIPRHHPGFLQRREWDSNPRGPSGPTP